MTKLYNENFKYTDKGLALSNEVNELLRLLFKREIENGVSPRELSHLMHWVINDLELDSIITNDAQTHKKNAYAAATALKEILKEKGFLFTTVGIHASEGKEEKIIVYSHKEDKDLKKYIESLGNQFQTFAVQIKEIKEK